MSDLFDCRGRTALVTGASRGLGKEAALALAGAGATVILNGRDPTALTSTLVLIRDAGGVADMIFGDITFEASQIVAEAVALRGGLDIVVHAAAARNRRPTAELQRADFGSLIDTNLTAAYDLAREGVPHLLQSDAGRLIFISSIAALLARAGDPAYAAAKGGLSALTRALAVEFGRTSLTVNAIAPGLFATEANAGLVADAETKEVVDLRIPMRRWGRPSEIASSVLFLASYASSFVNGTTVTVDGGLSAQM
jgi:gluconate 5-dehydrogenase